MLTGENGLINQTINASKQTDIAGTREQIELELMARYDNEGNYTNNNVIEAVKIVTGQDIEEGTETITTAKGNEVDISDLWKKTPKVGDYVNYTPDTGTYTVASGGIGSGYPSNQSFTTEALAWRILSISEETGEMELISATAGQVLYLQGADGYNHGVDILNDLCETLYSKTVNGTRVATGRSINVEDINAKTTYNYTTSTNYGTVSTPSNKQYPKIYMSELGKTVNGLDETADLLKGSERVEKGTKNEDGVTEYTENQGSATASKLYATYTYYQYNPESYLNTELGINTAPIGLINLESSNYWLASRCVTSGSYAACYIVRSVSFYGLVSDNDFLFYSNGRNASTVSHPYRPVVSLKSEVEIEIDLENSTNDVTYWNIEF